jgi:hypothetical protein
VNSRTMRKALADFVSRRLAHNSGEIFRNARIPVRMSGVRVQFVSALSGLRSDLENRNRYLWGYQQNFR